ncbi:hypothetical protein J6T66_05455 [bacterium]|nr:hypothetical protein [bacterium]
MSDITSDDNQPKENTGDNAENKTKDNSDTEVKDNQVSLKDVMVDL